jgi:hypothetical protein
MTLGRVGVLADDDDADGVEWFAKCAKDDRGVGGDRIPRNALGVDSVADVLKRP